MKSILISTRDSTTTGDKIALINQMFYGKRENKWDSDSEKWMDTKSILEKSLRSHFGVSEANRMLEEFYGNESFFIDKDTGAVIMNVEEVPEFYFQFKSFLRKVCPMVTIELVDFVEPPLIEILKFNYASVIHEGHVSSTRSIPDELTWEEVEALCLLQEELGATETHTFVQFKCDTCFEETGNHWHLEFCPSFPPFK